MEIEYFPIVDASGRTIGKASRTECHASTFLLHPVVHLHVFNSNNELLLQKRAASKDIQPNKWDTSVGGHVNYGEQIEVALMRESAEELGIVDFEPEFLFQYPFHSSVEAELVHSFRCVYDGEIVFERAEISEVRFWTISEIVDNIGTDIFTENFEIEFRKLQEVIHQNILK